MHTILDFNIYEPLENVYHIEDATNTCATLIVGENRALLVDTCTGAGDLKSVVETLTDKPLTVVNTHSHLDHMGGNYQFPVVLMNEKEISVGKRYIRDYDIRPEIIKRFESEGYEMDEKREKEYLSYDMGNVVSLDMDEEIDLGKLHVCPVKMYSHSPGMTGYYVKEKELLLGGDSVCVMACLYFDESSSLLQHAHMLKEVSKLQFKHILTSHSKNLLDRDDFQAMQEAVETYDESKTHRYRDPFYSTLGGRMYIYESQKGRNAIVVAKKGG